MPLWDKASAEFCFAKSRELLSKPFPSPCPPPHNSCRDLNTRQKNLEKKFHEMALGSVYYSHQYRDRTLTKSENMTRKTYTSEAKFNNRFDNSFLNEIRPPPPSPFNVRSEEHRSERKSSFGEYEKSYTPVEAYDNIFVYDNHTYINEHPETSSAYIGGDVARPRALSFSDSQETVPRKSNHGKSIRDRNRRRQSYNPRAYLESSSSDSECTSVGSVDLDWRRRKRLNRLSTSNSSIRSEMTPRTWGTSSRFLKPESGYKLLGKSPPPSSSILSGLSPTSVTRVQRKEAASSSSDSSL